MIKHFNGDIALGPDGFPMFFFFFFFPRFAGILFILTLWGVLLYFHEMGTFASNLNATFLSLIPKKAKTVEVKDFKPISLVGGMYKIISEVLANRLRMVLHKLVSPSQMPLCKGGKFRIRSSLLMRYWIVG